MRSSSQLGNDVGLSTTREQREQWGAKRASAMTSRDVCAVPRSEAD